MKLPFLIVLMLLALATSAYAECAWVLWWRWESAEVEPSWRVFQAMSSEAECQKEAKRLNASRFYDGTMLSRRNGLSHGGC